MTGVSFTAYGIPQPKGSTRSFVHKGRAITTSDNPKLKDWQHTIAQAAALEAKGAQLHGPVTVSARFYLPRPKTKKKAGWHTTRPDLDKLVRAVKDALSGVVYADDGCVVKITASKQYTDDGLAPRVCVDAIAVTGE